MKINSININCSASVRCNSRFYSSLDNLSNTAHYNFSTGVNKLFGEIDSGNWCVSYLLSMYKYKKHRKRELILLDPPKITVNDEPMTLDELSEYCCYMDTSYPMFFGNNSVKKLITNGLKRSRSNLLCNHIKDCFELSNERFERPLNHLGNEIFRAMAAIGFANGKEIYCFPWVASNNLNRIGFEI